MAKVRIKDIAQKAGVSVGTVDRVIHGRGRVAKEVEEKVKAAIELLNYQPNLAARSLARNKVHKVAIVIPNHEGDEFWGAQRRGVLRGLKDIKDFGLTGDVYTFNDRVHGDLLNLMPQIFSGEYEALIIAPTVTEDANVILAECEQRSIYYVQINSFLERVNEYSLGYVGQDSYRSGRLAGKLLDISTPKNSSIALLHMEEDVENSSHMISKEEGFNSYFEGNSNFRLSSHRFPSFDDKVRLKVFVNQLINGTDPIKGLFVTTSRVHHIVEILQGLNRTDISLVGFDIIPQNINALSLYESLFLINQNPSLQGYYGIRRLFDYILRKKRADDKKYLPLDIITLENVSNYRHMQDRDNVGKDFL